MEAGRAPRLRGFGRLPARLHLGDALTVGQTARDGVFERDRVGRRLQAAVAQPHERDE
jgi:hypothetical protein